MLTEFNTPEIERLALLIGAVVAVYYKDKYGVIPGGIIVPGYLIILFILSPLWCITTVLLSFAVYFTYQRFLIQSSYKQRTPMYILGAISLGIANLFSLMYIRSGVFEPTVETVYGTLMPGIIAYTFTKQNPVKVVKGMTICTLFTALLLTLIYTIGSNFFNLDFNTINSLYINLDPLQLKYNVLQFYVALGTGYLIYRSQGIRSGGYMVAPLAATLLLKPMTAIIFLLGCFLVYFATQLLCELTLTVGLKRYALVLCLSVIFVWGVELLVGHIDPTLLPFQGSQFFVVIAILSYVNDVILYQGKKIFMYMILSIFISVGTILGIDIFSALTI